MACRYSVRPSALWRGDWGDFEIDAAVMLAAIAPDTTAAMRGLATIAPTLRVADPHHLPGGSAGDPVRRA